MSGNVQRAHNRVHLPSRSVDPRGLPSTRGCRISAPCCAARASRATHVLAPVRDGLAQVAELSPPKACAILRAADPWRTARPGCSFRTTPLDAGALEPARRRWRASRAALGRRGSVLIYPRSRRGETGARFVADLCTGSARRSRRRFIGRRPRSAEAGSSSSAPSRARRLPPQHWLRPAACWTAAQAATAPAARPGRGGFDRDGCRRFPRRHRHHVGHRRRR